MPPDDARGAELSVAENNAAVPDENAFHPPTRNALCRMRTQGELGAAAWEEALAFAGFRPGRHRRLQYRQRLLTVCGILLFVAGIVFFIAADWNDMHRFARFGLTSGAISAFGLAALRLGPDSPSGKVCLLACGLAVGPHLAVFGQTYQTGAELWELFRIWCVILFLLALVGRQSALWLSVFVTGSLWSMLYYGEFERYLLLPEPAAASLAALAAWEIAARKAEPDSRLRARWLPRLLYLNASVKLTLTLSEWITTENSYFSIPSLFLPHPEVWTVFLYVTTCVGGCTLYRFKIQDLFMPFLSLASLAFLTAAVLIREEFLFHSGSLALSLLGWSLIIVGLTAAAAVAFRYMQRGMLQKADMQDGGPTEKKQGTGFPFSRADEVPSWPALWTRLKSLGLLDSPPRVPAADRPESPWYARLLIALGGWLAALLFLASLLLFLSTLDAFDAGPHIVASLLIMAVAFPLLRANGAFTGNFGFTLALAGAGGVLVGMHEVLSDWSVLCFVWAAFLAATIPLMPSTAYRFLASSAVVCLIPAALTGTARDISGEPAVSLDYSVCFRLTAVWWLVLCAAVVLCWSREKDWLGSPRAAAIMPPALHGAFAGMAAYQLVALLLLQMPYEEATLFPFLLFPRSLFLGPAVGLLIPALLAVGTQNGEKTARSAMPKWKSFVPIAACVFTLTIAGYFVPGLALALFGFALALYLGSAVLSGVSGTCLFLFLVQYYYAVELPLKTKSLLLAATGAALLGAAYTARCVRLFTGRRPDEEGGRA
ncbi:MAG: DUF4401 domain-containing protein [Desulfovibrio sp.]|jgi:uncharacterized membrane protein|nr:DUF4401 domain-containing protein [Desulfovibrio sp.]